MCAFPFDILQAVDFRPACDVDQSCLVHSVESRHVIVKHDGGGGAVRPDPRQLGVDRPYNSMPGNVRQKATILTIAYLWLKR